MKKRCQWLQRKSCAPVIPMETLTNVRSTTTMVSMNAVFPWNGVDFQVSANERKTPGVVQKKLEKKVSSVSPLATNLQWTV